MAGDGEEGDSSQRDDGDDEDHRPAGDALLALTSPGVRATLSWPERRQGW